MRCNEWNDRLAGYLAGEATEEQRRQAEDHLSSCPRCRVEVNGLRETWNALGRLSEPAPPSDRMRSRLREAIAERVRRPGVSRRALGAIAAALTGAAFLAGYLAHGMAAGPVPRAEPGGARWLLLLYDRPGEETQSPEEAGRVVEEYRAWARRLAGKGRLLGGEKLMDTASLWTASGPSEPPAGAPRIGGYFLIVARNAEEATAIARSCPHLARGGRLELRQIDPV